MKTNCTKALSLLLVLAFLMSAVPLFGLTSAAETAEIELDDGSAWLTELGSNVAFTQNAPGDYIFNGVDGTTANTDFSVISKTGFVAGEDVYGVALDFRGTAPQFGFTDETVLESDNRVTFYREESANKTTLSVYVDGQKYEVWNGTATRASMCKIAIVEQDGSFYLSFRGTVVDGAGLADAAQEYLKLENHFSGELLANGGMLHFFLKAASFNPSNPPRIVKLGAITQAYSASTGYTFGGDTNTPASWSFTGAVPAVAFDSTSRKYTYTAAAAGTSVRLGLPVAQVGGAAEDAVFSAKITRDAAPSSNEWLSVDFSNDPAFTDGAVESVSTVEIGGATQVHFIYGGKTITANYNMYNGANTSFTFSGDEENVTGLLINVGGQQVNVTLTGNVLKVGEPIYARFNKPASNVTRTYTITVPAFNDSAIAVRDALVNCTTEDAVAAKALAEAYLATDIAFDVAAQEKLTAVYQAYEQQIGSLAKAIDDAVAALPPIDELLWQDKEAIDAVTAQYDSAPAEVKALVTSAVRIEEYRAAAAALVDTGVYRTGDGTRYRVQYDPAYIQIGSRAGDNALTATILGGQNDPKSALSIVTENTYPILSGQYEMSYYFGNLANDQSSTFGLAADMADALGDGSTNNTFALVRTESGNVNTFYVVAEGAVTPCYVAKGTTRARNWLVGVTKIDNDYYMTVDGTAVTGEGYSAAVQEALKLNNHFSREFLEHNGSVHFYVRSKSMNAGASLRPSVKVENNLILNTQNRYTDRNGATAIAEYNIPAATSLTTTADGNVYTFQVPSAGSVTLAEPVNPDGFQVKAYMPLASGNQWVKFTLSNDPTFSDGTEVSFHLIQFTNGQNVVYADGKEQTARFSGFYGNSTVRTLSLVEQDGVYRLRIYTPGNDLMASTLDLTALIGQPIYLKISGDAGVEPAFTITNCATDTPYLTTQAALDAATESLLAEEAVAVAQALDAAIGEIYVRSTDFCLYKDEAAQLRTRMAQLSARQDGAVSGKAQLQEIWEYLVSLPDTVNEETLAECRKALLSLTKPVVSYDFCRDGVLDIRDLVRIGDLLEAELKK